jgi:hypothetical protein
MPNRHDKGSTTAPSVDEVALIRDTISPYAPVLIAPLSIRIRRASVQKIWSARQMGIARLVVGVFDDEVAGGPVSLLEVHGEPVENIV